MCPGNGTVCSHGVTEVRVLVAASQVSSHGLCARGVGCLPACGSAWPQPPCPRCRTSSAHPAHCQLSSSVQSLWGAGEALPWAYSRAASSLVWAQNCPQGPLCPTTDAHPVPLLFPPIPCPHPKSKARSSREPGGRCAGQVTRARTQRSAHRDTSEGRRGCSSWSCPLLGVSEDLWASSSSLTGRCWPQGPWASAGCAP